MKRAPIYAAVATAVAGAAAGLAISASGQATPDPTSGTRTFTATDVKGAFKYVDAKPKGPSGGDVLAFTQKLTENGTSAGLVDVDGVVITKKIISFSGTLVLSNGSIVVSGSGGTNAKSTALAITGGTGVYAGARGSAVEKDSGKNSKITLTFVK